LNTLIQTKNTFAVSATAMPETRHSQNSAMLTPKHGQHDHERRGEQPGQVPDAAREPHLVAHGPQHVVAAEEKEEVGERPEERPRLARAYLDDLG
jgi:hypothetical protein